MLSMRICLLKCKATIWDDVGNTSNQDETFYLEHIQQTFKYREWSSQVCLNSSTLPALIASEDNGDQLPPLLSTFALTAID